MFVTSRSTTRGLHVGLWILVAGCGGASGTASSGATAAPSPCPADPGFCAVLVSNDCEPETCRHEALDGLETLELVPLDMGVAREDDGMVIERRADGVFFAAVGAGGYRVRPVGRRFRGFMVTIDDGRVEVDTRATSTGGGRLVGHVRIEVGGGADGNTAISSGGPGAYLVASIIPFVDDRQVDRSFVRFAITDAEGRFELRLPAGRYYVSDINEANEVGVHTFGQNMTPIRGQEVTITDGDVIGLELVASELAP